MTDIFPMEFMTHRVQVEGLNNTTTLPVCSFLFWLHHTRREGQGLPVFLPGCP